MNYGDNTGDQFVEILVVIPADINNEEIALYTRLQELSDENDKLDDYFECIIECDVLKSSDCKRICRSVLM